MSHLSREKLDLLTRTKKIVGQLEAVGRALDQDEPCTEVLQRLAAARGAINSLMGELMEDIGNRYLDVAEAIRQNILNGRADAPGQSPSLGDQTSEEPNRVVRHRP